jgi:hypothetical protein
VSNIYRYALPGVRHFQLPHALDKWLNSISFEEIRLLLLIHSEAERTSLSEVELSTETIGRMVLAVRRRVRVFPFQTDRSLPSAR